MAHHPTPLKFLFPGWYAIVMGLSGLSLAWHRASPLMGDPAGMVSLAIGLLAAAVFVVLAAATVLRGMRHADAWRDHSHANAIAALTCSKDGEKRVVECFGKRVIIVPYVMPGFALPSKYGVMRPSAASYVSRM